MWEKYCHTNPRLDRVQCDLNGPLFEAACKAEEEGHRVIKINIGNLAPFNFPPPQNIVEKARYALEHFAGYGPTKGTVEARKSIVRYHQGRGIKLNDDIERVYIGIGVSELIMLVCQALCADDDEVLIPSPDYPLWTAAVNLAGGKTVHYNCLEEQGWIPDCEDIESKITERTRAICLINPNNPTGAVYNKETLEKVIDICRRHNLMLLSDEIYDRITYDGVEHISTASLADDIPIITFNGASKSNRICGFRVGWLVLSGPFEQCTGFMGYLNKLVGLRLCPVTPLQTVIPTCLEEDFSIYELTKPGGRLYEQRNLTFKRINEIDGLSCVNAKGSLYVYVNIDLSKFTFKDDVDFATKLVTEGHVLVCDGTSFNSYDNHHFRIVFLPELADLEFALDAIERVCNKYRK